MKTIFSTYLIFCAVLVLNAQHEKVLNNSNSNSNSTLEPKSSTEIRFESKKNSDSKDMNAFSVALSQFNFNYNLAQINTTRKSFNDGEIAVLNRQLEILKKFDADGFDYNFNFYLAGNFNVDRYFALQKAEKLQPKNNQVTEELLGYHLIMENTQEAKRYYDLLLKRNHFSKEVLDYASDVVKCIPNRAIVITHGEKDTYPIFNALKLQKKNATLLNLDFLTSYKYRQNLKSKGLKLPKGNVIDTKYFSELCALNSNVYVAMSLPASYLKEVKSKVNTYGLLYAYNKSVDASQNEVLWKKMGKDILSNDTPLALRLSANYIPMLISYYKMADAETKETITEKLKEILKGIGKEEKLDKILDVE